MERKGKEMIGCYNEKNKESEWREKKGWKKMGSYEEKNNNRSK